MEYNELKMLQALPLEIKVAKTKLRIREFVDFIGQENVYIAFSGGKDSTVLAHIVRQEYPNIPLVFSNTGLEYADIQRFVNTFDNVVMLRPKKNFKEVLEEEGYPIVSKKTARMVHDLQNPTDRNERSRKLYLSDYCLDKEGNYTERKNNSFKVANKWRKLIDAPFKVSHKCCDYLKKQPLKSYEKETGKRPIIGTMANESKMRESTYLQTGCNTMDEIKGSSKPLGFWTEQDVLKYIVDNNVEICKVYGDITEENGKYTLSGEQRTGCVYCGFGAHLENGKNRYQRLELIDKNQYNYCINELGFGEVLDFIGVEYKN